MTRRYLTPSMRHVATVLLEHPADERYGYDVAKATGLLGGTVQRHLSFFEAQGWLTSRREDIDMHAEGRRPRRMYQLTDEGRDKLAAILADPHRAQRRAAIARAMDRLARRVGL